MKVAETHILCMQGASETHLFLKIAAAASFFFFIFLNDDCV